MDNAIKRLGETVKIWGASTGTDDLGNTIKTWDQDRGTCVGVVAYPKANDALFAGGKLADTDKTLIVPSDADIATDDRIEIDSIIYDLFGTKADWKLKHGTATQYLHLYLKRVM